MPLELGFGDIGDEVVFELAGRFEIAGRRNGGTAGDGRRVR